MPTVALKRSETEVLSKTITYYQQSTSDLKFICSDGDVKTHQAILSWSSSFLRRLFMSQSILQDGGKSKEEIYLFLPNYPKKTVQNLIYFFSCGELKLMVPKNFADDFEQLWDDLKIDKITYKEVFEAGRLLGTSNPSKRGRKLTTSSSSSPVTPSRKMLQDGKQPPGPLLRKFGFGSPRTSSAPSPIISKTKSVPEKQFLSRNQSLSITNPNLSSTPIRPEVKKSKFKPSNLTSVPEKNNSQVLFNDKSKNDKDDKIVIDDDDDAPVIVDEVAVKKITPINIKHELPAGIVITKQVTITKNEENPPTTALISNSKEATSTGGTASEGKTKTSASSTPKPVQNINSMTSKPNSSTNRIAQSKLKRAKSLGRKQPLNVSSVSSMAGRRMSRRTSSAIPTYNEDLIQSKLFDKKTKKNSKESSTNKPVLNESFQKKIVQNTKKLRIPLMKLKDDKVSTLKQKKDIAQKARTRLNSSNANDIDVVTTKDGDNGKEASSATVSIPVSTFMKMDPEAEPIPCYICKKTKDDKNRVLSLKNVSVLRSHVSICLYSTGKLFKAIPPGKDNTDVNGRPIEEFGGKSGKKYSCEVEGCWLAARKGRNGQIGYKEFAIHMSAQHGALEMVLMEDGEEAEKLMDKLMEYEGNKNVSIIKAEDVPQVETLQENVFVVKDEKQETETKSNESTSVNKSTSKSRLRVGSSSVGSTKCFFCGEALNFKDLLKLKDHYSRCLYKEKNFTDLVPPGPDNSGDGFDEEKSGYKCEILGCWHQRKASLLSYKAFALHMASQHGILEKILEKDTRPALKTVLKRLIETGSAQSDQYLQCRFPSCSNLQFKAENKREIKLHYASQHFADSFKFNEAGVPENFTKTGNRTMCNTCSENSTKPVYIQSEKDALRGHLVVKHDIMDKVLLEAFNDHKVQEAKSAYKDIYPDLYTDKFGND